ncbi:hypothetical protein [Nocardia sp. NPDC057353]|uniref:hypothetical protein n=1 Tax=Nocardia sp. NPDC057353 TaxID=3346104 RepID=UPI00363D762A
MGLIGVAGGTATAQPDLEACAILESTIRGQLENLSQVDPAVYPEVAPQILASVHAIRMNMEQQGCPAGPSIESMLLPPAPEQKTFYDAPTGNRRPPITESCEALADSLGSGPIINPADFIMDPLSAAVRFTCGQIAGLEGDAEKQRTAVCQSLETLIWSVVPLIDVQQLDRLFGNPATYCP